MPQVPVLTSFSAGTIIQSAAMNNNLASLRNTINSYAALIDQVNTFTFLQTFNVGIAAKFIRRAIAAADTVIAGDLGKVLDCTGTYDLTLTAAATLGDGFQFCVRNVSTGIITINPNGSETIDGLLTLAIGQGQACIIVCDGSNFRTLAVTRGAGAQYYSQPYSLTDAATIAIDWDNGNVQSVTIGATGRAVTFTNARKGGRYVLIVKQDGTGSRTITTWPAVVDWAGGAPPVLTITANKKDAIGFIGDTDGRFVGSALLNA